ncbi:2Fe-2S iron-sulfur cluster-binding protein [Skermanella mucosa]|uniref:2Fe-2S iron-sulfur cluster-binding protein n=1 Tax=Skermanella mucosa TaxID=1789672 RepID=UPI00192AFBFD|nr:2Fe-2S iron-sulfur cluster-binding protein [Skermanella mucosa]UEM21333.1 2Fe-2S iron-sulfur cluster-binding protein [Skermanella mucosa]
MALIGSALAQTDPGDHSAHHPGSVAPTQPTPGATAPANPGTGVTPMPGVQPGAGCGGMMGCMGSGPRPFYTTLLDMPALTPEARRFIETEAERRLGWGAQAIAAGQVRLEHALAASNPMAVEQAAAVVRQGLLQIESGTAALRAVEAGTPPRQFALAWFRDQLGVEAAEAAPMAMGGSPWGLSWYHLSTMGFLVAFLAGTLLIQYARMRRIGGLVKRLMPSPSAAPDSVTVSGVPPGLGPATLASVNAAALPGRMPAPAATKHPWSGVLRVAAIFTETHNVKTFRLIEPEGGDFPFTFLPGQFLTFSAEIDGKPVRRSYTIASSPAQHSYVEIAVKREEQGTESRYLHDQVSIGDLLQVFGPSGVFTFTGEEAGSIVLIGGGIGITPMMCVIRYLTDRAFPGDIFFLYGARTVEDFVFREELEYLQKRHLNLHVAATMMSASETTWQGAWGPISKEFIAHAVPEIARRRVHVCGPPAMMEAVKAELLELGVARDKIKTEAFGPAQGRVPAAAPPQAAAASAPSPSLDTGRPPSATAQVEFTLSGKTAPLTPDQTVLDAAESIGVDIDYSCRVGTCGTCAVPLKAGTVTMEVEEGLPPEEKARGIILACQAKSLGSLVVEA